MIIIKSILVGAVLLLAVACGEDNGGPTATPSEPAGNTAPAPIPEETQDPAVVDGTLHVIGGEWRFEVPTSLDAGPIEIAFENVSSIFPHELRLVRLDEEDPSLRKIARMPRKKIDDLVTELGRIPSTPQGDEGTRTLKIKLTSGRYGMLCLLDAFPSGTHAERGMFAEITVTS